MHTATEATANPYAPGLVSDRATHWLQQTSLRLCPSLLGEQDFKETAIPFIGSGSLLFVFLLREVVLLFGTGLQIMSDHVGTRDLAGAWRDRRATEKTVTDPGCRAAVAAAPIRSDLGEASPNDRRAAIP